MAAEAGHGGICPENPAVHRQAGTRQSHRLSSDAPLEAAGRAVVLIGNRWRGLEGQRARVDAIALAGRGRAVPEDMAQVTAAATAHYLGAAHEQAVVWP